MNTSTTKYAKNTLLSLTLLLPAIATAIWAGTLGGELCLLAVLTALGLALGAFCFLRRKDDLVHDFFLPIILFAALGGMTWAVRGSSGFGAVKGCVFAGVMWGAAWWFIARNPGGPQTRRYSSGWIILALTIGIGLSGNRGWMQWPSFFDGVLQTNAGKNEFVAISPAYGFLWLFIAGVPWAGIGACLLAWCATEKPLAAWQWAVRLFCGFGAAFFATWLYKQYPQWFLPLYGTLHDRYADAEANPNLKRLINDNGAAIQHLGFYLGFLLYEIGRRDWKNTILIGTVGLVNGLGWALCQNWKWADNVWPDAQFNFWRCWESSGGISIGIALGVAYYLVNRRAVPCTCTCAPSSARPGFPFFGAVSMIFMTVALLWYAVVNGSAVIGPEWPLHLPFCAVLIYGLGLYFWKLRASLLVSAASGNSPAPRLGNWAAHFGLMLLIGWFMMALVEMGETPDPATPWWGRFDFLYLGVTVAYGLLYFLTALWKILTTRPTEEATVAPFFQRYPNLDWLAVYLSLTIIACSFFRGELYPWHGWLWLVNENPPLWTGLLGLACLTAFGLIWCALNYFRPREDDGGLERFAVHLGLLLGLGMSLKNGTRGWANNYLGDEDYWGEVFWRYIGPGMLIVLAAIVLLALAQRVMAKRAGDAVPHAFALIILVLAQQNIIAHFITGPPTNWNEVVFNIYYVLLFLMTAVIFYHYHFVQTRAPFLGAELAYVKTLEPPVLATVAGDEVPDYTKEDSEHVLDVAEMEPETLGLDETVTDSPEEGIVSDAEATVELPVVPQEQEAPVDAFEADVTMPVEERDLVESETEYESASEVPLEALDATSTDDSTDVEATRVLDVEEDTLATSPDGVVEPDEEPGSESGLRLP